MLESAKWFVTNWKSFQSKLGSRDSSNLVFKSWDAAGMNDRYSLERWMSEQMLHGLNAPLNVVWHFSRNETEKLATPSD
jgi:hypothetical protein